MYPESGSCACQTDKACPPKIVTIMQAFLSVLALSTLCASRLATAKDKEEANWGNVTGTSPVTFPQNVGFGGEQKSGGSPFNAMVDTLGSDHDDVVEMRWKPKDADKDHSSWEDLWYNLGEFAPYHAAKRVFPDMVPHSTVPKHCTIKQAHVLHRHGAKFPDKGHKNGPGNFGKIVSDQRKQGKLNVSGDLSFLEDFDYDLGQKILTHQGSEQMFRSGVKHYYDYAQLLDKYHKKPVFRTSSHSRVVDSARYFGLGFFGLDASNHYNLEVLTETDYQNNTLAPKNACRNADNDDFMYDEYLSSQWQDIYLEAPRKRLQKNFHSYNLTKTDVYNMMLSCPYLTSGIGFSQFCHLFTKEEWENFAYDQDLQLVGKHGFQNPTARAVGVPYVQELVSRLQKHKFTGPVTAQNMTITSNETYFPLDQPLYIDFSHHSVMFSVVTALNLTQFKEEFNPTKPNPKRKLRSGDVTPMGMRLAWEVLDCEDQDMYIRLKLNDVVYPLDESNGCEKRNDGLCKLDTYASYLDKHAYDASKFDLACFGKNGTDFVLTGPVQDGTIPQHAIKK